MKFIKAWTAGEKVCSNSIGSLDIYRYYSSSVYIEQYRFYLLNFLFSSEKICFSPTQCSHDSPKSSGCDSIDDSIRKDFENVSLQKIIFFLPIERITVVHIRYYIQLIHSLHFEWHVTHFTVIQCHLWIEKWEKPENCSTFLAATFSVFLRHSERQRIARYTPFIFTIRQHICTSFPRMTANGTYCSQPSYEIHK